MSGIMEMFALVPWIVKSDAGYRVGHQRYTVQRY